MKDVTFGSATESYVGTASGGTLTVSDAQHDTANISLVGDYVNSTFTLSNDGNGGTLVVDPVVTHDTASGTVSFDEPTSAGTYTVSVAAQGGGSDYVGDFTIDAPNASNGQETVDWQFDLNSSSITQTITQSYNVTVADTQPDGVNNTTAQTVSVTVGGPGNDNFVFAPGIGADTITNFNPQQDPIELEHFANAQTVQELQSLITSDAHGDAIINLGHNDSITLAGVTTSELQQVIQAGHVLLH